MLVLPGVGAGQESSAPPAARMPVEAVDTLPPPVLLVPGWSDRAEEMESLRKRFVASGWPPERVRVIEFADPLGSNRDHARELAAFLEAVRKTKGSPVVDVVAHSMGGLALRWLMARKGGEGIRRVVFLGTPHEGTVTAFLAWGEGGREMEPGSPFLDSLRAYPPVPRGVEALVVRTRTDLRVLPGEHARLPDGERIENVEVCCPSHPGLLEDEEVFRRMRAFLREGREEAEREGGKGKAWP